jgi:DNA-binding transcriptional MerR regulator
VNTTIHTIEDLIRILDDHPEWADALRARLLTRELIELPEKFTQFVAEVNRFVEATNRRFDTLENRVMSIQEDVDTLKKDVSTLKEDVSTLKEDVGVIKGDVGILKIRVKSIQDDLGPLKGSHARDAALREASILAEDMGFQRTKTLTQDDLGALLARADTSGIPTNELRSFRRADLIIEATDPNGATCYIAVEISFTVNGRDTTRARRNAAFLTKFTGDRSYPAVAGLRRDDRIHGLIDSGEVFWYQLDPEVLEAE